MVQGSSLIRPRTVTGDGEGLVSHAGIAWLAETADLAGLTNGLSTAMAAVPQRSMFGTVASEPTVWRTFDQRHCCVDRSGVSRSVPW